MPYAGCQKGEKGDPGPAGSNGANGTDGVDGNANVIGTNTVIVSNWNMTGSFYTAEITASGITQDIVNTGLVSVFIKYGSYWYSLPDINGKNSTSYGFSVGKVELFNQNSDYSVPVYPGSLTFRIVIISSTRIRANPGTDWNDYNEISSVFNFSE